MTFFKPASPRRNAGSQHMDASVSVSFCPPPATASAEGRLIKGGPFPASVTAEGAQLNVPPFPATASAEGRLIKGGPSLWEKALTGARVLATSWAPRPGP